jgi:hypothetical protein
MRAKFKLIHLQKVFAVVSVSQLRARGLAVFQNDYPYPGHALLRHTDDMPAAEFGTTFLRIPSFCIDIVSTTGSRELHWVTMNKEDVHQSMPFHGIEGNVIWRTEEA